MSEFSAIDTFKSISKPSTGIYKELGSKFLSFAYPINSEDEIKGILASIRKSYFDARHHCYAYRIGKEGEIWRANDDGEPSSTGGKPILGQLLSNELSDVLIVVVRYFGGTKLGVPGLIRAYRSAAADAIANSEIIDKTLMRELVISFDYIQMNDILKKTRDLQAEIVEQQFDNLCQLKLRIREGNLSKFCEIMTDYNATILLCN
ncbi:MAG: YigZ family protein [Bacteroidales bacterium]|nr:YigZ family protein [Bacteroidales bacterium]